MLSLIHISNDVAGCGSPDDGIIQKDKTLSLDHGTVGGKLHLDARIPELLSGFNKSAAHIPVSYTHLDVYKRQAEGSS